MSLSHVINCNEICSDYANAKYVISTDRLNRGVWASRRDEIGDCLHNIFTYLFAIFAREFAYNIKCTMQSTLYICKENE